MKKRKAISIQNGWQKRYAHYISRKIGQSTKTKYANPNDTTFSGLKRYRRERVAVHDQRELDFYRTHFSEGLDRKNHHYMERHQLKRVRTIEELYVNPKTAPEEVIFRIDSCTHGKLDMHLAKKIIVKQLQWESEQFKQIHYFIHTLHAVESTECSYFRVRRVWIAHDKFGSKIVSERKSLREMGLMRSDSSMKNGYFNNAKMVYVAACCNHLRLLCISHTLNITIMSMRKKR